jgi:hypothetical protein
VRTVETGPPLLFIVSKNMEYIVMCHNSSKGDLILWCVPYQRGLRSLHGRMFFVGRMIEIIVEVMMVELGILVCEEKKEKIIRENKM